MDEPQKVQPQPVRAILLPEPFYQFLMNVFESYVRGGGITTAELAVASETYKRLDAAQSVDFSSLGKMKVDAAGPGNLALSTVDEPSPGVNPTAASD